MNAITGLDMLVARYTASGLILHNVGCRHVEAFVRNGENPMGNTSFVTLEEVSKLRGRGCKTCTPRVAGQPEPKRETYTVRAGGLRPHHVGREVVDMGVIESVTFSARGIHVQINGTRYIVTLDTPVTYYGKGKTQ